MLSFLPSLGVLIGPTAGQVGWWIFPTGFPSPPGVKPGVPGPGGQPGPPSPDSGTGRPGRIGGIYIGGTGGTGGGHPGTAGGTGNPGGTDRAGIIVSTGLPDPSGYSGGPGAQGPDHPG